jgi:hypothetical protein
MAGQSQPRQKIDVSKLGPQVGERVPDFSLKDQAGKTWTTSIHHGAEGRDARFSALRGHTNGDQKGAGRNFHRPDEA